jgi:hypothetical protein
MIGNNRLRRAEKLRNIEPELMVKAERCGKETRMLGGWGTWSGGHGVICPTCLGEHVIAAMQPPVTP